MTVTGSSLINTSATGQPSDNEDRPFSFAIGTQIFINPSDDPTDAVVTFKVDPTLLAGTLVSGTSNLALGFAIDSQLNTLSGWGESNISTASPNIFAVGFPAMIIVGLFVLIFAMNGIGMRMQYLWNLGLHGIKSSILGVS